MAEVRTHSNRFNQPFLNLLLWVRYKILLHTVLLHTELPTKVFSHRFVGTTMVACKSKTPMSGILELLHMSESSTCEPIVVMSIVVGSLWSPLTRLDAKPESSAGWPKKFSGLTSTKLPCAALANPLSLPVPGVLFTLHTIVCAEGPLRQILPAENGKGGQERHLVR